MKNEKKFVEHGHKLGENMWHKVSKIIREEINKFPETEDEETVQNYAIFGLVLNLVDTIVCSAEKINMGSKQELLELIIKMLREAILDGKQNLTYK